MKVLRHVYTLIESCPDVEERGQVPRYILMAYFGFWADFYA